MYIYPNFRSPSLMLPTTEHPLMSSDPLLQPYKIKHLTLRNRIMTTAH